MKAVFLDRDGVINEDRDDYVKNVSELKIFPHVADSIRRLNDAGFAVFVVSNQQGIAKGIILEEDLQAMQAEITRSITDSGGTISAFYYCRHLAALGCSCRKPRAGMLFDAAEEHGIDLKASFMVGDSERDLAAGRTAGCGTVLVLTGKLKKCDVESLQCAPDFVAGDLAGAVQCILNCAGK